MAKAKIVMTVHVKWWFTYLYMPGMLLTMKVCKWFNSDAQPDWERVAYWTKKAVVLKVSDKN